MKRLAVVLGSVLILAAAAPAAAMVRSQSLVPPNARIFAVENGVLVRVEEPKVHFSLARFNFDGGNRYSAAQEIRRAAVFLGAAADRAPGLRRKQLLASQRELYAVARAVRRGEIESFEMVEPAFARANLALYRYSDA